jgi:hypothetical protein
MKIRFVLISTSSAILALCFTFVVTQEAIITAEQALYTTLIVILGILPSAIALVDRREAGLIPLMPLHGLFYAFTFGVPVYFSGIEWISASQEALNLALILTIVGLICLYFGYYLFQNFFSKLRPLVFLSEVSIQRQKRLALSLYGICFLLQFVQSYAEVNLMRQMLGPLEYFSIGIFFKLSLNNKLSRFELFLLGVIIFYALIVKISSGSLASAIFFITFLMIIYWNERKRIPWQFILLIALITIILNPVKSVFRVNTWGELNSSLTIFDKALLFYELTNLHYSGQGILNSIGSDTSTANRLANTPTLSYVIQVTPEQVPYWLGESYETLWTSFIPRFIWPGKPEATIGNEFGQRYSLLGPSDFTTSYNLPWLTEFYANFGVIGIVVGMFAVGVLFRFLVQIFSASKKYPIEHLLGIVLTFNLFYAESNFALMMGGILLTLGAFFVLLHMLTIRLVNPAKINKGQLRHDTRQRNYPDSQ